MTASITIRFEINREAAISPLSAGLDAVAALTEQGHIVTEALIDFDNPLANGPIDIKNIVTKAKWGSTKSCELVSETSLEADW